ncbi:hypothetical protein ABK040_009902 [Willaertia magna]
MHLHHKHGQGKEHGHDLLRYEKEKRGKEIKEIEERLKQKLPLNELSEFPTIRDVHNFCLKNNLYSMSEGVVEFSPPEKLKHLVQKWTMVKDIHQYNPGIGSEIFLDGIVNLNKKHYKLHNLTVDNILACQGATGGIVSALAWIKEKGKSQIGLFTPFYTFHLQMVQQIFGIDTDKYCRFIPFKQTRKPNKSETFQEFPNFELELDSLEENYLKKGLLDCVIFTNPGNPTTIVYPKQQVEDLIKLCAKYNCFVILDECYIDFIWKKKNDSNLIDPVDVNDELVMDCLDSPIGNPEILNLKNLIVCRTFSKMLGCQAWRLGYLIAHPNHTKEIVKCLEPLYICAPYLQHAMGEFLLNNLNEYKQHLKEFGRLLRENYDTLKEPLCKCCHLEPIKPHGTMYGLFVHHKDKDIDAIKEGLKRGVGIATGCSFFKPGEENIESHLVRVNFAIDREKAIKIAKLLVDEQKAQ